MDTNTPNHESHSMTTNPTTTGPVFEPVHLYRPAMTEEQSRLLAAYDNHPTPRPEPDRAPDGRYRLRHPESGKPTNFTRVSTLIKTIDDTYNLQRWAQGYVALGVATHPHIAEKIAALDDPRDTDKRALQELAEEAKGLAGGSVAASVGTAIHAFTEHHDLGTGVLAPAPYDADVAAYAQALTDAGIHAPPQYVERILVNLTYNVAGTWDRLVIMMDDGTARILDVKTGASLDHGWTSIAAQLASYAGADHLLDDQGGWEKPPTIDQTTALVAHVPAGQGTCTLYEVNIEKGTEIARMCADVRTMRTRMKRKGTIANTLVTDFTPWGVPGKGLLAQTSANPNPHIELGGTSTASNGPDQANVTISTVASWPEATDETVIQAGKRYKADEPAEAVTALRAAWTATGISTKPPWTPDERQTILDLFHPSFDGTQTDPALQAKATEKLERQAARLDAPPEAARPLLPEPEDNGTPGDYTATRQLLASLRDTDPKAADILAMWVRDAKAHGRPLNGEPFTARKEAVVTLALHLLQHLYPVTYVRGTTPPSIHSLTSYLIDYVTDSDLAGHYPTGALLGALDAGEAENVRHSLRTWDSDTLAKAVISDAALDQPISTTPNQKADTQ